MNKIIYIMKTVLMLCVISFAGLSLAAASQQLKECIYINGICVRECEVGTYAYTTGCGYLQPEPTCANPTPEVDTSGIICDYSACYCNSPTVRNTESKKCVALEDCPK